MSASNGTLTKDSFKTSFTDLGPLIVQEWPEVDSDSLDGTGGDLDKVVSLVAQKTEHTKTLVRRQLTELSRMAADNGAEGRLKALIKRLEDKTSQLSGRVKDDMLPAAEQKVRDHLVVSLLVSSVLGFLLGVIVRGFGRR